MKKYILLYLLVFILACDNDKNINFDKKLIHKMSIEDFNLPSEFNMLILFAKCKDDNMTETDIQQLRIVYKTNYDSISFDQFLTNVLNQNIKLEKSDDIVCFELDSEITDFYKKNSFNNFYKNYCVRTNTGEYTLKEDISYNKRKTIFYYCYINNYLFLFDDVLGYYFLISTTKL